MPVIGECASSLIRPRQSAYAPTVGPDFPYPHRVVIPMEEPIVIPPNFDSLTPEEQEIIKDKYRFWGIRLRYDLSVPIKLTRETLDIP